MIDDDFIIIDNLLVLCFNLSFVTIALQLNPAKPMPVMVWIYGGGFQMGEASRDLYSPDYIMMENVVLISIAYRLGPLGKFLLPPDCFKKL